MWTLDRLCLTPHRFVDVESGVGAVPVVVAGGPACKPLPYHVLVSAHFDEQETGADPLGDAVERAPVGLLEVCCVQKGRDSGAQQVFQESMAGREQSAAFLLRIRWALHERLAHGVTLDNHEQISTREFASEM